MRSLGGIKVRSLVVLILLLVVVAGVAVNGSRAQPLPQTSVAFSHCQRHGNIALDNRCRPGGGIVPDAEETGFDREYTAASADMFGGDYADGERWRELVVLALRVADFVVSNWDRLWGGGLASAASMPQGIETLFDPVK